MLIIFVTMSLWDEPHRGRHHYANLLSKTHKVIWVNRNLKKGENDTRKGLEHIKEGLYVLHTGYPVIHPRLDARLNLNIRFRLELLNKELQRMNEKSPDLIWIYDFRSKDFARRYRSHARSIYFCNDYFGESAYKKYEKKLAEYVDNVFCTAPKLAQRFRDINQKTLFLPHGTDIPDINPRIKSDSKPSKIGYVGTLREQIDVKYLQRIVNSTNFKLILSGPIINCSSQKRKNIENLIRHHRVEYRGDLGRSDAFATINELDICLLPYEKTFKTQHNFVIKYFEYLSLGKPIVATPYFDWPEPYGNYVMVFNETEMTEELFHKVYDAWTLAKSNEAISFTKKNTWKHRIDEISGYVGMQL